MPAISLHSAQPIALASGDKNGLAIKSQDATQREKIEEAAIKFEGMFITQMFKEMRKATEQLNPDSATASDKSCSALLDHAYSLVADNIASQRAFGIADAIVAQMLPADLRTSDTDDTDDTESTDATPSTSDAPFERITQA